MFLIIAFCFLSLISVKIFQILKFSMIFCIFRFYSFFSSCCGTLMSVHRVSLITSEKLAILDCNLLLNLQQTDTLRTSLLESLSYLFNVCGPSLKDLAKYLLPQNIMIVKASKQTAKSVLSHQHHLNVVHLE